MLYFHARRFIFRMKTKNFKLLGLGYFLIGIFLLLNTKLEITGAVIGSSNGTSFFSLILGLLFISLGGMITLVGSEEGGLEKITWDYGKDAKKYQEFKEDLKSRGYRVNEDKEKGDITFGEYLNFLTEAKYNKLDSELKESYIHDFDEYNGIKDKSEKKRYLNKRLNEINEEDIDRAKEIREMLNKESKHPKTEVLISKQAIDRSEKDNYIIRNTRDYINEIDRISQLPLSRPAEKIGDFKVSPRGNKKIRVAWRYKKNPDGSETVFIDDLLYHVTSDNYVDNWIDKARDGDIKAKDYTNHKKHNL